MQINKHAVEKLTKNIIFLLPLDGEVDQLAQRPSKMSSSLSVFAWIY